MVNGNTSAFTLKEIPVALLAGGLATRLGPIAENTPKALVDIDGRPFIDHQLALLHRHGIRRVVLCVGHMGEQIEQYLGDGSVHGMSIQYSHDGTVPLGTGGAIRRALPLLGDIFWVMYGDSYMDINYAAVLARFLDWGVAGLMTVIRNDDCWDRSNAIFEDGRLTSYDKTRRVPEMRYIDYGVQLLRREALASVQPDKRCDLADLYRGMVTHGRMIGHEVFNRFYEIGTPTSLAETRRHLLEVNRPKYRKSA